MKQQDLHFDGAILNVRRILVAIVVGGVAVASFVGMLFVLEKTARAFLIGTNFFKAAETILQSRNAPLGILLSATLLIPYLTTRFAYLMAKRYRMPTLLLLDRVHDHLNSGWLEPKEGRRPGLARQMCRPFLAMLTACLANLGFVYFGPALIGADPSAAGDVKDFFALLLLPFLSFLYPILMGVAVFLILGTKRRPPEWPCCVQCDYNLTGNVSGVCPECGTAIPIAEMQKAAAQTTATGESRSDGMS